MENKIDLGAEVPVDLPVKRGRGRPPKPVTEPPEKKKAGRPPVENPKTANKDYFNEYYHQHKNIFVRCECGFFYAHINKAKHVKTRRHLRGIAGDIVIL